MLAQLEADQKEREASKTPPPLSAPTLLGKAYAKENKKSQLDFLLNKASEYSQFIAGDLKDLQNQMAEKAAADADTDTTPKGKKRSKNSSTPNKATLGSKAIFTQPRVLAKGCLLKDYQVSPEHTRRKLCVFMKLTSERASARGTQPFVHAAFMAHLCSHCIHE